MAMVTESRQLFEGDLKIVSFDPSYPLALQKQEGTLYTNPSTPLPTLSPPAQTTTSWRTGRRDDGLSDQYDAIGTEAGVFKALKAYDQASGQSGFDRGHTFHSYKQEMMTSHPSIHLHHGSGRDYVGPLIVNPATLDWPAYPLPFTSIDTGVLGTQAINRVIPTHPATGLAVALAELKREGLPHLHGAQSLKSRSLSARTAGREYLNSEFGWKPLVNDVRSLASTLARADRILSQFRRDAGRLVRRKYSFPRQVDVLGSQGTGSLLPVGHDTNFNDRMMGGAQNGPTEETLVVYRDVWFSGAFQYYMPSGDSTWDHVMQRGQEAQRLFGIDISPDVLWNLQPWSWLADWHWNIGQVISNVSALHSDGLVLRYGYLMVRTTVEHTATLTCGVTPGGYNIGPVSTTWVSTTKERIQATPYGFGLNASQFTERQKAILAAIAVTR